MKIRLNITPFEIIMRYGWEKGTQRKKNATYRNYHSKGTQMNPSDMRARISIPKYKKKTSLEAEKPET